jgi:hypothetical protein
MIRDGLLTPVTGTVMAFIVLLACQSLALADDITVHDADELRSALRHAQPGATILLAPGNYGNGIWIEKVDGTKDQRILISGADAQNPPIFMGGNEAMRFADCNYITLRNVKVSGCAGNGINADDGGSYATPSKGMVFENVTIEDIGPTGNRDGLKLSGLDDFVVRNCMFSGWGGSAIDMVGCHDGIVEKSRFLGKVGYSQDTGIQAKGGSARILVRQNFFKNAGARAINLGGSTGLEFFRPKPQGYEAKDIEVAGNHFVGSSAPVAYVTSIDCVVRRNTFIHPDKWVMRILQEQPTDAFRRCQRGVFEANLVVFDERVQTFVNIGPNTEAETFSFRNNAWFCTDGNRRPSLPSKERNALYQVNPLLANAETPELEMKSKDPRLQAIGAHALADQD